MTNSKAAEAYLSSGEAARILGVSTVTVAKMAQDGRLPVAAVAGGYRLFRVADVEALAKERRKAGR